MMSNPKHRSGRLAAIVLLLLFVIASLPAVDAGTSERPEIIDSNSDSARTLGSSIQHLEITKAWIETRDGRLVFTLEILGGPDELPGETGYVFHYTFDTLRAYWLADPQEDGSINFTGGVYRGTPGVDRFGSTRYQYFPGNASLRVDGNYQPGANARFTWSYPVANYGTPGEDPIFFTGMFVASYIEEPEGLTMIDEARGRDYLYIHTDPWYDRLWSKMTPGLSAPLLIAALVAVAAFAGARRHPRE